MSRVPRPLGILAGLVAGALVGLWVGRTAVQLLVRHGGLVESELLAAALFVGYGTPVVGAVVGVVVAARSTRPPG